MSAAQLRYEKLLLQEHFGPVVARVAECLCTSERTLKQIMSVSSMTRGEVQRALCSLYQHDLVAVRNEGRGKLTTYFYSLRHQKILLRARIPRMLSLTGDLLGPDAELIVQQLLLHGRSQLPGLAASIRQAGSDMSDERLVECFKLLLAHRLVRRVLPPMPEDSNDAAGASLFDSSLQYDPFTEHNVDFSTVPRSHPAVVTPKRKRSASADAGSTAGKRRKLAAPGGLEGGDDGDNGAVAPKLGSAGSDLPEWVPNYGQFTRHLRSRWIQSYVTSISDAAAGRVVQVLLEKDLMVDDLHIGMGLQMFPHEVFKEATRRGSDSLPSTVDGVSSAVELTNTLTSQYLAVIAKDPGGIVVDMGGSYQINYGEACKLARVLCIEKIITAKHGQQACQLFRIVREKKHIEQKQVKELALLGTLKETKILLNKMFFDGFLLLREIPKQGIREPASCVYIWTFDIIAISKMLIEQCYKVQGNLTVRRAAVQSQYSSAKAQVRKLDDSDEKADRSRAEQYEEEIRQLSDKLDKLDGALLEVDEQLLVFQDFEERQSQGHELAPYR